MATMTDIASPPVLKRHVAAAVAGNALEFYDFTTYAYFAIQIGHAFFPSRAPFVSLILSLMTFGAGFLLRPVGAVVIGRYADRVGRKPAMLVSLTLMGVAVLGLALTPSYAQIGPAAAFLALGWRLVQGFALGGEVGPSTTFLVEAAPPHRRGLYASWQAVGQAAAAMAGGLVGLAIANLAGEADLASWGWRAALLIGGLVLPFGYWLRRTLPETLHRADSSPTSHPADARFSGHARILLLGVALICAATVGTYVIGYMTTYAITTLHIPPRMSLWTPTAVGAVGIVSSLAGGVLCDRFGRKPLMIWPRAAVLLMIMPAFMLIVRNHDAVTLVAAISLLAVFGGLSGAAVYVGLIESMHRGLRSTGMGLVYSGTVALFGGTTQPMIAWLIHVTGDPLAPGWYMTAACAVGLAASLAFTESARPRAPAAATAPA
jgi:MFS family permease